MMTNFSNQFVKMASQTHTFVWTLVGNGGQSKLSSLFFTLGYMQIYTYSTTEDLD